LVDQFVVNFLITMAQIREKKGEEYCHCTKDLEYLK